MNSSEFTAYPPTPKDPPLLSCTQPASALLDVDIKSLWVSCGYSMLDIPRLRQWYTPYATIEPPSLDQSPRMSQAKFIQLLKDAPVHFPGENYYIRMFQLFDMDQSGDLDFREFCTSLMWANADVPRHPGKQWFRCRLEFIFDFYDTDRDHVLNPEELVHLFRHLIRASTNPPEPALTQQAGVYMNKAEAWVLAQEIKVDPLPSTPSLVSPSPFPPSTPSPSPTGLSFAQFVHMVEENWFREQGFHLSQIVCVPSFRKSLSSVEVSVCLPSSLVSEEISKKKRFRLEEKKVQFSEVTNRIPIEVETPMRSYSTGPGHPHKKNIGKSSPMSYRMTTPSTSAPPLPSSSSSSPPLPNLVQQSWDRLRSLFTAEDGPRPYPPLLMSTACKACQSSTQGSRLGGICDRCKGVFCTTCFPAQVLHHPRRHLDLLIEWCAICNTQQHQRQDPTFPSSTPSIKKGPSPPPT